MTGTRVTGSCAADSTAPSFAAEQYGSDAIAGVVNIILKEADHSE